jgi:hypothetical protein
MNKDKVLLMQILNLFSLAIVVDCLAYWASYANGQVVLIW